MPHAERDEVILQDDEEPRITPRGLLARRFPEADRRERTGRQIGGRTGRSLLAATCRVADFFRKVLTRANG
jgi:hypothetical protein